MRLRRRNSSETHDPPVEPGGEIVEQQPRVELDPIEARWTPASWLITAAGAALAVVGIVAAARTGLNETWYRPVEPVADIDHTPFLAVIEIGVGAVLVILGLAGARLLSILVCLAAVVAAGVVAINPEEFQRELAIERWWAITLAVTAAALAVMALLPWPTAAERRRGAERRTGRRSRRPYGRAVPQP